MSNPEHMGMRPPTTTPGQHLGFHDRLQALRQDSSSGSSILSGSPTPPLPAIAENWEIHSAHSVFSDTASSCGSDTFTDMNSPLPHFDALDNFGRSAPELSEMKPLPLDPLDGFARSPYEEEIATTKDSFAPTSALTRSSSYPDPTTAFLSPNSAGSPYDFSVPAFSEFTSRESQRGLLDHFCNVLSHLIVFKEDQETLSDNSYFLWLKGAPSFSTQFLPSQALILSTETCKSKSERWICTQRLCKDWRVS